MNIIKTIWNWYYKKFIAEGGGNVELDKLKWLPKTLLPNKNEPFDYIDTIYFDIEKIPIKEEIIMDMEVEKCVVQN